MPTAEEEDTPTNECPAYDTKLSDGKAPVMLELSRMQSIPLLPSLPDPLWPGVQALHKVLFIAQIEPLKQTNDMLN